MDLVTPHSSTEIEIQKQGYQASLKTRLLYSCSTCLCYTMFLNTARMPLLPVQAVRFEGRYQNNAQSLQAPDTLGVSLRAEIQVTEDVDQVYLVRPLTA